MLLLGVNADTYQLDHDMRCVVVVNMMAKISQSTVAGGRGNSAGGE